MNLVKTQSIAKECYTASAKRITIRLIRLAQANKMQDI